MNDLMKKFNMAKLKPMSTPMCTATILDPNENGKAVDQREYRSIIGSLLYITAIRPDIQFVVYQKPRKPLQRPSDPLAPAFVCR